MGGPKERKYFDSADYSMNKDVQQQQQSEPAAAGAGSNPTPAAASSAETTEVAESTEAPPALIR